MAMFGDDTEFDATGPGAPEPPDPPSHPPDAPAAPQLNPAGRDMSASGESPLGGEAPAAGDNAAGDGARAWQESFFRVWIPTLVVALFIITFNLQAFEIPSASMENTLLIGDHLLVDRVRFSPPARWGPELPYRAPRDGDVVVFMSVTEPDLHLVKRVIGVPGDRIHMEDKIVYRNGQRLNEPYAVHAPMPGCGPYIPEEAGRDDFPAEVPAEATPEWAATYSRYVQGNDLVVPPKSYFVMGDNRECSFDSRYWGFVPQANMIGRPTIVYWSYRSTEADYELTGIGPRVRGVLSALIHAPERTRWSRTFHLVR